MSLDYSTLVMAGTKTKIQNAEIRVFLKPSEKEIIRKQAEKWGIGMGTLMKIAYYNFRDNLDVEASDRTIKAINSSIGETGIKSKGRKASELLDSLDD